MLSSSLFAVQGTYGNKIENIREFVSALRPVNQQRGDTVNKPLWQPSPQRIQSSLVTQFISHIEERYQVTVGDYHGLYQWSIGAPEDFWGAVWDFCQVIAPVRGEQILVPHQEMRKVQFFPGARLNYAENLLRRRDKDTAIYFSNETGEVSSLSFQNLYNKVSQLTQVLADLGVQQGDRVAGYLPNIPEAVIAMLATASLGAVWCACSPDFGVSGVLDRFGQIAPKVLFVADGYLYNGKTFDCLERVKSIQEGLPQVIKTIVVPYMEAAPPVKDLRDAVLLPEIMANYEPKNISFVHVPFNHPLFIMFTSGTTGQPKCIVHGVGGTLLQHLKEHQLHCDIRPNDRVFYFTTCSWMMWNWQISALASSAALVLYDGSPTSPSERILFDYAEKVGATLFGVSAKYIDAIKKANLRPIETHNLDSVRLITSTGSSLAAESFDYIYEAVKKDVSLASISGGTDIISCFVLGAPVLPVWRGEIQTRGLGMAVEVYNDAGLPAREQKGELVCTAAFPSMPVGFWNDADGQKYHDAYFARFPNVWCHGDMTEIKQHGGIIIHGRSDAVLNPGGVRIGTGEIYRQVELIYEVVESLAIGQEWENDSRIVLFVKLRPGVILDEELKSKIKTQIRLNATPRHMPAKIIQVNDIPRTKSGKIVELAVRNVVHNQPVLNTEALANPEALAHFKDLPELQS